MYDVLIVGGGAAGLSAALLLGRCRRSTLVAADGPTRNAAAQALHGLMGHEGLAPGELLAKAREELRRYNSVVIRETRIVDVTLDKESGRFRFRCNDDTEGLARKILLATGLADNVPDIPGFSECYGISVHHCLYCDGFEHRDEPLAAYGHGEKGVGLALMLRHYSKDVVLLSDGSIEADEDAVAARLKPHDIAWWPQRVEALDADGGRLRQIRFADGDRLPRLALFFSTGCRPNSDLGERLGLVRDDNGGIVIDPETEETSVSGVYAAGDASRDTLLLAAAIGEGARAAVAIDRALLKEDGLLA